MSLHSAPRESRKAPLPVPGCRSTIADIEGGLCLIGAAPQPFVGISDV
jgi:hypothetical protein